MSVKEEIDTVKMGKIHNSLVSLFNEMSSRLIERDQLIRLIGLTFFCKANCFLLGDRGVGKSYAIEKLGNSIDGTSPLWQLMLKKDTKIEEVFGRTYQDEKGEWLINTKNSLLEANNIFADEMFKAQGELLSGLLEVLVDRTYTFGDGKKRATDILAFFGASNEYPTERYMLPYVDRFDLWIEVKPIQSIENRRKYYRDEYNKKPLEGKYITREDIELVYGIESHKIEIEDHIMDLYIEITTSFINSQIKTSDRKYRRILRLIRTIAYLNNRKYVNYSDLFILLYSAWQNEVEKSRVERDLYDIIFGKYESINAFVSELENDYNNNVLNSFNSTFFKFYNYKYDFTGEMQDAKYKNIINGFETLILNINVILEQIELILKRYKFNLMVKKQLDENIIIVNVESNVFNDLLIKRINDLKKNLNIKKNDIKEWLRLNSDLYNYKNNQKKNFEH